MGASTTSTAAREAAMQPRRSWLLPVFLAYSIVSIGGSSILADPLFPNQMFEVGDSPLALVLADFNSDGRLDLATANLGSHDVSVLLGLGRGDFRPEGRYPAGQNPYSLAVADFNEDENPDIVTANHKSADASVLFGNVDGTFLPPIQFPAGDRPYSVAAGDLNGDGHADFAVANEFSSYMSVYLGNGDGSFGPEIRVQVGEGQYAVVIVDLNSDQRNDLAVTSASQSLLYVLSGMVGGGFFPPESYFIKDLPFGSKGLKAGDLNLDGNPDLLATGGGVSVFFGDGAGGFSRLEFPYVSRGSGIEDIDGDGNPDLVMRDGMGFWIAYGDGAGNFSPLSSPFSSELLVAGGHDLSGVVSGDFDENGSPDLAFSASPADVVAVVLNDPDHRFGTRSFYIPETSLFCFDLGDLNQDGYPDGVAVGPRVSILINDGTGRLEWESDVNVGPGPYQVVMEDFDSDAVPDIAVANTGNVVGLPPEESTDISVLYGQGDGTLGGERRFGVGARPQFLTVADFNEDGAKDLAVGNVNSHDLSLLLGDGAGGFATEQRIPLSGTPFAVITTDLNNDGHQDLAVNGNEDVAILLGDGMGGFSPETRFPAGMFVWNATAGDFNLDGNPDLAIDIIEPDNIRVAVLLGNGDGTFQPAVKYRAGLDLSDPVEWTGIASGDFNGDGFPDLVVTEGRESGDISLILGQGNGTFGTPIHHGAGPYSWPTWVSVGDLDLDARRDLAVASYGNSSVKVMKNRGPFPAGSRCFGFEQERPLQEFTDDAMHLIGGGFWGARDPGGNHGGTPPYAGVSGGVLSYRGGQGGGADRLFLQRAMTGSRPDWVLSGRFQYGSKDCSAGAQFILDDPGSGFHFSVPQGTRIELDGVEGPLVTSPDIWYLFEIRNFEAAGIAELRIWQEGAARPAGPILTTQSTGPLDIIRLVGDDQCAPEARIGVLCVGRFDCNGNGIDDLIDISTGTSPDCNGNDLPDECEYDADSDGVTDACDGCPADPEKANPGLCGCGLRDIDTDLDGLLDCEDNCPKNPDPDQANFDGDGGGDNCDPDDDGDDYLDALDCSLFDSLLWSAPGEVLNLTAVQGAAIGEVSLAWDPPINSGAASPAYDTLRSDLASDFHSAAICVESGDTSDTTADDVEILSPGDIRYFLIRASTACGDGPLGTDSAGQPRTARSCP